MWFIGRRRGTGLPPAGGQGEDGMKAPPAANENLPILSPGKDPAAALSRVRAILARKRQENARHGTLLACPERRRDYEECRALERALLWTYFERG
jgi:hypothetical protein